MKVVKGITFTQKQIYVCHLKNLVFWTRDIISWYHIYVAYVANENNLPPYIHSAKDNINFKNCALLVVTYLENGKTFKDSFFVKNRKMLNVKGNRTLEQVLNDDIWQKLFDSFKNNNWVECSQKCSREVVDKKYGIGYFTN